MMGDISEIIYDLVGTKSYRHSRAFVEHLRSIPSSHPMEVSFSSAFHVNQKNTADFLAGKFTPELETEVQQLICS